MPHVCIWEITWVWHTQSSLSLAGNIGMEKSRIITSSWERHWCGWQKRTYILYTQSPPEGKDGKSLQWGRGEVGGGLKLGLSQSEMWTVQGKSWPSPTSLRCEDAVFPAPPSPLASLNLILIWKHLVISIQLMPVSLQTTHARKLPFSPQF